MTSVLPLTRRCTLGLTAFRSLTATWLSRAIRSHVSPVRTLDGVLWLNDSKATNLHALEAALKSQNSPVILIAGGKDKGLDYRCV